MKVCWSTPEYGSARAGRELRFPDLPPPGTEHFPFIGKPGTRRQQGLRVWVVQSVYGRPRRRPTLKKIKLGFTDSGAARCLRKFPAEASNLIEYLMRASSRLCGLPILLIAISCIAGCQAVSSYPLRTSWRQKDVVVASISLSKKLNLEEYRRIATVEAMRFFSSPSPTNHPVYEVFCEFFVSGKGGGAPERVARVKISTSLAGCEDEERLKLSLKSRTYIYY